ncbi:MAG: hypothetical protein ACKVJE_14090, partial [Pseudomonadales bacterium]
VINGALKTIQKNRVSTFLKCVDLRYDVMSIAEQSQLNEYITSDSGQEILADFSGSIMKTSSQRALMALAILYCKDPDFEFDEIQKRVFVSAMNGMTDDLLNFFIEASKLETQQGNFPFPRAGIYSKNIDDFKIKGWNEEAVFININELIGLRLLLPDPQAFSAEAVIHSGWTVFFGITDTSRKIASLIQKASALLDKT